MSNATASKRGAESDLLRKCREIYTAAGDDVGSYSLNQKDYNKTWLLRLDKLMSYIEDGENSIPGVLARYRNYWLSGRYQSGEMIPFIVHGQPVSLLAASGHTYYRHAMAHAVIAAVRPDTAAIVELGSGIGESLFTVWSERFTDWGGRRPRKVRLIACELSPAGRKASRVLAALDPRISFEARHFDYRTPRFDGLNFDGKHVIVFSTQSIEQVAEIPVDFIDHVTSLAHSVTALHFEPIGWQCYSGPESDIVHRHRERCLSMKYNTNFWSLLTGAADNKRVEIVEVIPYFLGFEYNPLCKIVWKSMPR